MQGAEIAALQFTNAGTAACRLGGFPTVVLLRSGSPVGTPSQPTGQQPRTMRLAPGDTVQSMLTDYSSCSAPLSDQVRVTVPGLALTSTRPIQLRACTLRVAPLTSTG